MKKLIIALLTALIMCTVTACQASNIPGNIDTTISTNATQSTNITEHIYVSPRLLYFNDIDSYNEYIAEADLPDSFITAEELACFGTFDGFCSVSDFYNEDYSWYQYSFIDPNGFYLRVVIKHTPDEEITATNILTMSDNMTDMRILDEAQSGIIIRNNISYFYSRRIHLSSISFCIDGVNVKLDPDEGFSEYPMNGQETVIKQLLSISDEDVVEAMSDIQSAISSTSSNS